MEGERGTEEDETGRQLWDGKRIRPASQMLAMHSYKKNPDSPVGNEDLRKDIHLSTRWSTITTSSGGWQRM